MKIARYLFSLSGSYLGLTNIALAQSNFDFRQEWLDTFGGPTLEANTFIDVLQNLAGFLFVIGTVVAGIAILWAGVAYMSAGNNSTRVASAKAIFKNGIIGAVIIFAIGLILNTISALVVDPTSFFG